MVRVLLLIPSRTYRTHDFMTAASRLDVEVVVGSEHRPALAGLMDGRHLRLDFENVDGSTQRIVAFAQTRPLSAIIAVDDAGTLLAAAAAQALGLPHNPVDPLNGPFFEETIYVTPSRLSRDRQAEIQATTARAARALGLTDGPIHAELRLNERGTWMLEVAARSIGGLCSRTLRFGSGISLEELILRHAAGLPMPSHQRERAAAGVMMLPIRERGRLRAVEGQREAKAVPGVEGLVITIPPGEPLVPLPEGDRYLGFMFARAGSPDAVEAALRRAHAQLSVLTDG